MKFFKKTKRQFVRKKKNTSPGSPDTQAKSTYLGFCVPGHDFF
jgi:hypothetical protein